MQCVLLAAKLVVTIIAEWLVSCTANPNLHRRMAGRELHSWILLMCMASVFNHMFTVFMVFGCA